MSTPLSPPTAGSLTSQSQSHAPTELPRAIGYMGATAIVVGTITGSGVFLVPRVVILRRRRPRLARPYRVWAYPVLPPAFTVAALIIIVNAFARSPRESGSGLGLVLLGIPIYLVWTRFTRSLQNTAAPGDK